MEQWLLESRLAEVQRKWGYVVAASFEPQVFGSVLPLYVGHESYPIRIVSLATVEEFLEQRRFMGISHGDVADWYFYRVETD